MQEVAPSVFTYSPAGHGIQAVDFVPGCTYPLAHCVHLAVPVELLKLPASHDVQTVTEPSLYSPSSHWLQPVLPALDSSPWREGEINFRCTNLV